MATCTSSNVPWPAPVAHEHVDVLIVGAGVAGLTAAHRLLSSQQQRPPPSLLVLEAADYAGGRVKAVPWGPDGLHLNVGAHWVAGDGPQHPMRHLLDHALQAMPPHKQARCKVTNFDLESLPMFAADGSVLQYDWAPILAALERMEQRAAAKQQQQACCGSGAASRCPRHSAGGAQARGDDAVEDHDCGLSLAEALAAVNWRPQTQADRAAMWLLSDYEWGTPASATPLKHTVPAPYHVAFGSDKQRLMATDGGSPDLLRPLLQRARPYLRLGERVTGVVQHGAGSAPQLVTVTVEARDAASGAVARKTYSASVVVLTASLGVLASHAIRFEPPLPVDKLAALARHKCMADYEVVIAEFPERFWASHAPPGGHCMMYAGPPRMVLHDLSSYFEDRRPLLEFHMAGDDAVRMSTQPLEQTRREVVGILQKIFGRHVADPAVLEPTRLVCTGWGSNPLTRGAFSVRPLGLTGAEQAAIMRPYGAVFFAGDGCHGVHSGYLHAAYLSGLETADAVQRHVAAQRAREAEAGGAVPERAAVCRL